MILSSVSATKHEYTSLWELASRKSDNSNLVSRKTQPLRTQFTNTLNWDVPTSVTETVTGVMAPLPYSEKPACFQLAMYQNVICIREPMHMLMHSHRAWQLNTYF